MRDARTTTGDGHIGHQHATTGLQGATMHALMYCRCRDCLADKAQEEVERLFRDREALAARIERLIETCAIEGGVTDFARDLAGALSEVEWTTGRRRASAALGYFDRLRKRVLEVSA